MTNKEKWECYTSALPSPDSYITWGWLYLIAASLQRRVWCPPAHEPMFANMFVVPTGEPGIGKGGIIRAVNRILTYHKLEDFKPFNAAMSDQDKINANRVAEDTLKRAQGEVESGGKKNGQISKALLFPDAPDATTYESLVESMAGSLRYANFIEWDEKQQKNCWKVRGHSSMYFCLEEMASIFRKNTESLINFLIQTYDCGETYRYKTKTGGEDRIIRVCLNFFAGTTSDFMQSTFDEKLTNQGFSSRTFFIFALKNRKSVFFRPELTAEQKQCEADILNHVYKLASLYGQVQLEPETVAFLEEWIQQDNLHPELRASQSPKLKAYYARKNIHIMKVAMALHFGESTELLIPLSTFQKAIALLHEEEKTMALALMVGNRNPLAKPATKVVDFLTNCGDRTSDELLAEFWGDIRKTELEEILNYLQQTDKVKAVQKADEITKETHIYYQAIK